MTVFLLEVDLMLVVGNQRLGRAPYCRVLMLTNDTRTHAQIE